MGESNEKNRVIRFKEASSNFVKWWKTAQRDKGKGNKEFSSTKCNKDSKAA